jgi:hypothetical protein
MSNMAARILAVEVMNIKQRESFMEKLRGLGGFFDPDLRRIKKLKVGGRERKRAGPERNPGCSELVNGKGVEKLFDSIAEQVLKEQSIQTRPDKRERRMTRYYRIHLLYLTSPK